MLEAANARPRFTISLKRSTPNLQLSTSRWPITPSLGHVWTAPWQGLSDGAAALVGCGHVSGLWCGGCGRWP